MFDIGATELLMIVIVAVVVIGPKDMPLAFRTAGRWIGKMRKLSSHFRTGLDAMVREAELEDMEKQWKAQNEKIMRDHPQGASAEMEPTGAYPPKSLTAEQSADASGSIDADAAQSAAAKPQVETAPEQPVDGAKTPSAARTKPAKAKPSAKISAPAEPELPLDPADKKD